MSIIYCSSRLTAHSSSFSPCQPPDRAIDIQICRLRRKLGDDARLPTMIKTVRNGGYVFAQQVRRGTQAWRSG